MNSSIFTLGKTVNCWTYFSDHHMGHSHFSKFHTHYVPDIFDDELDFLDNIFASSDALGGDNDKYDKNDALDNLGNAENEDIETLDTLEAKETQRTIKIK
jgi:hypothetical protein